MYLLVRCDVSDTKVTAIDYDALLDGLTNMIADLDLPNRYVDVSQDAIEAIRVLRAALAESERDAGRAQKPVAWRESYSGKHGEKWLFYEAPDWLDGLAIEPLYAAPVPAQPAVVPEVVAKKSARAVAVSWCQLKHSTKKDLLQSFGIVCPQGKSETDFSWSLRALEAMGNRPECVAAILSTTDTEVRKDE